MGTDYLFYYFAPLTSFWFVIVYTTLRIGSSRNGGLGFVFGKLVVSACLVKMLHKPHGPLAFVFRYILQGDLHEWRFRVLLDPYVVYIGMLVAIGVSCSNSAPSAASADRTSIGKTESADVESSSSEIAPIQATSKASMLDRHRAPMLIGSLTALLLYTTFMIRTTDKYAYNAIHPYISPLPILAFLIFRNATPTLRNHHSRAFAWLGRCSLETFTLQFHIWLAADTKGLLSTGLFDDRMSGGRVVMAGRWKDFALLTPVFLWVSWRVAGAMGRLTTWIVGAGQGTKVMDLPGGSPAKGDVGIRGFWAWFCKVRGDLRVRIGLLLGFLWVLKVV